MSRLLGWSKMYNIKRKVSNEFKDNKEYIFISILISILTILPEIVFSSSLIHTVFLLFLLFLLFLISKFSKTIFSVFIIYLNFVNMVIMHVSIHWGNMHKFEPILELAYLSPKYETIEYLSDYLGYADILIVMYSLSVYYILYKYITHYRHSYKVLRLISISVMVIVYTLFSIATK